MRKRMKTKWQVKPGCEAVVNYCMAVTLEQFWARSMLCARYVCGGTRTFKLHIAGVRVDGGVSSCNIILFPTHRLCFVFFVITAGLSVALAFVHLILDDTLLSELFIQI